MRERPILFSAPMVRAILEGRKTQTRRAVKPQPEIVSPGPIPGPGSCARYAEVQGVGRTAVRVRCPYGEEDDRLWVREKWAYGIHGLAAATDDDKPIVYSADDDRRERTLDGRWRPSIHMPRTASRINLEITCVRVERLQDISYHDATAEGVARIPDGFGLPDGAHFHATDPRSSFWSLWDDINGCGAVASNPWVWVIEFKEVP